MKRVTATAAVSDQIIGADCLEKILKVVQEVEHEVKHRESSFHAQLQQVVDETEHRVEEQCRAEKEQAVSDTREATRRQVTEQLLTRFHIELAKLETEHQSEVDEMEKLVTLLNESAAATATQWQSERRKFQDRIAKLEGVIDAATAAQTEKLDNDKELERKLEEAAQSKAQLQLDLERAVSELKSQIQTSAKAESDQAAHTQVAAIVQSEMVRVRARLDEMEKMMSDPDTELGFEIRLRRETAELEAYLKGLRYSLGEVTLQSSNPRESCHA